MKRKLILYPILFLLFLISTYFAAGVLADYRLGLTDVYISKLNLPERTLIEEEYLEKIRVPKAYIKDDCYKDKEDIVGKYVKLDNCIPKGSLIYKNQVENIEQMRDASCMKLETGQVSFDLFVRNILVNPAKLTNGMYCDLYLTINRKEIVSDLLISGAKIIGLYDNNNQEIKNNETNAMVNIISIAINSNMVSYLNKAQSIGEISLIINNDPYQKQKTEIHLSEDLLKYLN